MARRARRATGGSRRGGRPPSARGEIPVDEFDRIDLPGGTPPAEPESEFEGIDLEMTSVGVQAPPAGLTAAKQRLEQRLLLGVTEQAMAAEAGTDAHGFENVVGVGISEKMIDAQFTNRLCVTVYVIAKVPKDQVHPEALVPEDVNGIPTDVIATGELHAQPYRGTYRPAPGGVSIGHYRITAGTVGCLVRRGRALFILSNNHVLANVNQARPGDPILQPGPYDGGQVPANVIAKLSQFVPIQLNGPANDVDCAIAQTNSRLVTPPNSAYGRIGATPVAPRLNLLVKKGGRTTQFTRGRITDVSATVRVGYGTSGAALFRNQIIIQSLTTAPFSQGGDSGSLIVTDAGNSPVALLFAGSASHTIANPIRTVLNALGVSIVT